MKSKVPERFLWFLQTGLTACVLVVITVLAIGCDEDPNPEVTLENPELEPFFTKARNSDMQSFLIFHEDAIEGLYLSNGDDGTAYDVRSVTKSITTTLIGIAIDKGYIESENETIGQYLERHTGPLEPSRANITILDLLTMRGGAKDEFYNSAEYFSWLAADDHIDYILHSAMVNEPGTEFSYNNGLMYLLAVILEESTEMSVGEFAKEHLFAPLGIEDHGWETVGGVANGGAGLKLTAREMAKIGALYLNKGMYNGTRIVSEQWIEKALTPHVATTGYGNYHYGFGWWLGSIDTVEYAYALGWAGQFIFVVPELELSVTATNPLGTSEDRAIDNTVFTRELVVNEVIKHYAQNGN